MDFSTTALLRRVPLFSQLEESFLQELARHSRRRRFGKNEALFREGDPGYTLYVLLSGQVRIETVAASGAPIHIAHRGPGEHFGELSLIDGKPRMADAITDSPCEVLMLDHAEFARCLEAAPRIALAMMATLADRLRQAADTVASQRELDVLGRVCEALLDLVAAHGVDEPSGGRRIGLRVTQPQLAAQTGTTRESVNRSLASLKTVNALRSAGRHLVVLDEKRLRQYAEK